MDDIFYFASPRKYVKIARYRPSARRTPKVIRRRRPAMMDAFDERACVARLEEPTFCPSSLSSLLFPTSSASGILPLHDVQHHQYSGNDEDEDDDDDHGGVRLPASLDDEMTDVHTLPGITYMQHGRTDQDDQDETHAHDDDLIPNPPISLTISHSQQQNQSRPTLVFPPLQQTASVESRLESARVHDELPSLAGASTAVALRNSDTSATDVHLHAFTIVSPATEHAQPLSSSENVRGGARIEQSHHLNARDANEMQHSHILDMDDDSLAVDDPKRHYDVADFMDTWRLHAIANKRLPLFEPGIQPSVQIGRPTEQVTRSHTLSGVVDMQGIRWHLVGPARTTACKARRMLHPSKFTPSYFRCGPADSPVAGDVESQYRFRSFLPGHRAKFEHYQLRNLLVATDRNNIFYSIASDKVLGASLASPTTQEVVVDLAKPKHTSAAFRITCLSAYSGSSEPSVENDLIIAGGFYGEYAVCKANSPGQQVSEGFVTHAYNGLVTHVHSFQGRRSGLPQAAFCSNDRKVRVMDVSSLKFTNAFNYENAINCSATSADGRLRVLVGDTTETLITDAQHGTPLVALRQHTDHGFACAWSRDNRHVATAAQDGRVMLWDARNWSIPVRDFDSNMSCARSLHFTDDSSLIAAENEDIVSIYAGSNFEQKQEIRFFGSIAGVAVLDGGAELAIANADKTVGGLLTFERQPRGLGNNTYRRIVAKAGAEGSSRWRHGRARRKMEAGYLEDQVMV